ncbi:hypothetical protein HEP83_49010 [Streptomyces sp. RLA2-12]|nr:hypothetical protein [Streptomyces sp. RLA2-12]
MRAMMASPKTSLQVKLSPSYDLTVGATSLSVTAVDAMLFPLDDMD